MIKLILATLLVIAGVALANPTGSETPGPSTPPAVSTLPPRSGAPTTVPATTGTDSTAVTPVRPANTNICKGHKEGDYIVDPKDPHVYYECIARGLAYRFVCPHQLIFNVEKKICDFDPKIPTVRPPDHGNSKFDCTGKKDGFYPDEHDKHKFHECSHGYPSDFTCPPTTIFVPSKNACDHENL